MKKKEREVTWLDTYGDGGYTYEDFVEYCKEENWDMQEDELEIPAEYSASYREWVQQQIEDDVECFFENLKYTKEVNGRCVVSGSLGLWDGRPEQIGIHADRDQAVKQLQAAIKAAISGQVKFYMA